MFKVSFSAFDILNFTRGFVYISYLEKKADKKLPAKNSCEFSEVKFSYFFPNYCDVFEEIKNFFNLAKDRAKMFNRELNNIKRVVRNQSSNNKLNVVTFESLEFSALAFYGEDKGFDLKKEYKLSELPSLSLKKELEKATMYFLKNFGLMSKISFRFKFDFRLNVFDEEISSDLYSTNTKQIDTKIFDKHTREIVKILSEPNLFDYSLIAEIEEFF
ncbi:hypothetical protein YS40_133 [Thermus phage phiYS40]|uniref:hypothetical protein n=1 Tax=Thermus phage phiYS40 TaxID=407392 RepID=UPI0000E689FB|nr:hypothetical protein YS40_133 [Thermus phage phiYS40]ABJ91527.1 hypothetical protein YS40_133 [Thermus phage phiYS40]BAK53651.1 hypothetical protein YSP_133 [Thermus phage phiYS40]